MSKYSSRMRRLALLVLTAVLLSCLPLGALSDGEAFGEDMRILSIEGTVRISNKKGMNLSFREGMKVYNGYSIATDYGSSAYIQLDDDKVVMLSENTQVDIKKRTYYLEMTLNVGELFFNVESPLKANETFNIRTSTMVTGIRGTSGYVLRADNAEAGYLRTIVGITDGHVAWDAAKGVAFIGETTGDIAAQQVGVFTHWPREHAQMGSRTMREEDIPGFAAAMIMQDEALQARIAEDTDLSLEAIGEIAKAYALEQEEHAARPDTEQPRGAAEAITRHNAVTYDKKRDAEPQEDTTPAPAATPAPTPTVSPSP